MATQPQRTGSPTELARELLLAVRRDEPTDEYVTALASTSADALAAALETDAAKTAFWVNLYNAWVQLLLERDPDLYASKRRFFGADRIDLAARRLSLDAVEHGMLRSSRWKYGLGYLPRPFPDAFERRLRVEELDPRIHFALNCGAASCPPIAAYTPEGIDDQLELATAGYLEQEVTYDPEAGVVRVPRLFLWYRGDFGGKRGILRMLRRHDCVPADATPRLKHRAYDWSRQPDAFVDEPLRTDQG